ARYRDFEGNRARAKESAAKASLLDPKLAEGHAALGAALFFLDLDWRQAQTEFRQALDLDPKNSNARHLYGSTLAVTGKVKEAITEIEQSVKDDPRFVMANRALASAYLWDKRYQDAVAQARKTLEITNAQVVPLVAMGLAYAELHRYDDALATLQ